jgi:hypothetical protein
MPAHTAGSMSADTRAMVTAYGGALALATFRPFIGFS